MPPDIQKNFIRLRDNIVSFPEYLLNKNESIQISVLASGEKDEIKQRGRIKGGSIRNSKPPKFNTIQMVVVMNVSITLGLFVYAFLNTYLKINGVLSFFIYFGLSMLFMALIYREADSIGFVLKKLWYSK